MEHHLESQTSTFKEIVKKRSKEIWPQVVSLIEDYFDFMIMDIIKGVYSELLRNTEFPVITSLLRKAFLSFWRNFVSHPIDTKIGWEYRQFYLKVLNEIPDFDEITKDFVLNTITQMGLEIQHLFTITSLPSGKLVCEVDEEYQNYLLNLVNEYIQMTYFDHFILGQALKMVFYTESYTFGEVYELRQKLNEFFRNFLHGLNSISGFKKLIQNLSDKMPISQYKMELFSKIILAHFGTVIRNRNQSESEFLQRLKTQILRRTNLIKTNLGFQTPSNIDRVKEWISSQIEQVLIYESLSDKDKLQLKGIITDIFNKFITHEIDLKESLHLINKIPQIKINIDSEPPNNRYDELFNQISYEQEDIMSMEEQTNSHSTSELLKALLYTISESIEVDPSLENLIELIHQIQFENSPGQDGFYI
jgi:hypothetical protein